MLKNFSRPGLVSKLSPEHEEQFHETMINTVWTLWTDKAGMILNSGGGVCIERSGYILTAAHVVNRNGSYRIMGSSIFNLSKCPFELELSYYNIELDLALLIVKQSGSEKFDYASICINENLQVGVTAYGIEHNPQSAYWSFFRGYVSASEGVCNGEGMPAHLKKIRTKTIGVGGSSGCPTFNCKGEVIGIFCCGRGVEHLIAPVKSINKFFKQGNVKMPIASSSSVEAPVI